FTHSGAISYAMLGAVIKRGDNDYILYYNHPYGGNFNDQRIYCTTSNDGINWEERNGTHDDEYIVKASDVFVNCTSYVIPQVTKIDGMWYMVGEGMTSEGWRIFMANSTDGYMWYGVNDGNYIGPVSDWDAGGMANPSLYKIGTNKFAIFYNGFPTEGPTVPFEIGILYSENVTSNYIAYSKNPILKLGDSEDWDSDRIEGARIFLDDVGKYSLKMLYFGLPDYRYSFADGQIGIAFSNDTATNTIIRYSESNNLTDITSGYLLYNGTDSEVTLGNIHGTYYFRAWAWNESGLFSDASDIFKFSTLTFPNGNGTASEPYQITHIDHLNLIRYYPWANYTLMNDLDFNNICHYINTSLKDVFTTGSGWDPIRNLTDRYSAGFSGTIDGKGYSINNLFINRPDTDKQGLFGYTEDATFYNLHVLNANVTGNNRCGILVATIRYGGKIEHCSVSGKITGNNRVGGLVGVTINTFVNYSFSEADVFAVSDSGGFVGDFAISTLSNCYSTGNVT
ncbi:MAG: hypothetical protein QCI00_10260, partial [Candidatus Thermoplasmatota archaeon]|nr:hypothetical protein [Candidatus Thermoplasmatota archaeon]